MPINKKLWTSSFVLLTAGLGTVSLVACLWLFDMVGANSQAVNVAGHRVSDGGCQRDLRVCCFGYRCASVQHDSLGAKPISETSTTRQSSLAHLGNGELASLGFALSMVAFWWFVLWLMWRKGWSIRV